jgi:hypothetical protein
VAICKDCGRDMLATDSCSIRSVVLDGRLWRRTRFGMERFYRSDEWVNRRCNDCGVNVGGIHHPCCDVEECPKCGGQLISCGCPDGAVALSAVVPERNDRLA